jgi:hypothetical protein
MLDCCTRGSDHFQIFQSIEEYLQLNLTQWRRYSNPQFQWQKLISLRLKAPGKREWWWSGWGWWELRLCEAQRSGANDEYTDRVSEKLIKLDAKRNEYQIVVVGEEPHLAYNRVGLTSYFDHRKVEQLYLNPQSWVSSTRTMV